MFLCEKKQLSSNQILIILFTFDLYRQVKNQKDDNRKKATGVKRI
jgi:hypothetical protein